MRDLGPVVWLPRNEIRVTAGYCGNRDDEELQTPITLTASGETHARLPTVLSRPMTPPRLEELVDTVHGTSHLFHLLGTHPTNGIWCEPIHTS